MHQMSAAFMVGDAPQNRQYWWDQLQPQFAELILVAPEPIGALAWKGLIVRGRHSPQAPLAAVRAALRVAQYELLVVIDSSASILTPAIITGVAAHAEQRWDVMALGGDPAADIMPVVFHKRCLKIMDHHLAQTDCALNAFFHQVRLETVDIKTFTL